MSNILASDRLTAFHKLNKNTQETILAPTESNYFLLSPEHNLEGLKSTSESFLNSYQVVHFFYSTESLVKILSTNAQVYLRLVISILNPGPVIMALKDKQDRSFLAYIPNQPELLEFLENSKYNWVGVLAKTDDNLPIISAQRALEEKSLNQLKIIQTQQTLHNIQPSVLDCRQENLVKFFQEGIIDSREVRSVLPKKIKLESDLQANFLSKAKVRKTSSKFKLASQADLQTPSLKLVLGSKENLQRTFEFSTLGYFVYKEKGGSILFNIGSSSHPATIAKSLYKNLYETRKFGIPQVLILNQNWGKSKWAKIIHQILAEISLDTLPEEVAVGSTSPALEGSLVY